MIIKKDFKNTLQVELLEAKSIWIATAMISYKGYMFIQDNVVENTIQHFLLGIDLSTEPKVFDELLNNLIINSRVYQADYTFHPKVYLIQKKDNSFTAFIGSSNTTIWGLDKNVEMNYQVNDQVECEKILKWFTELYLKGYLITEEFVNNYKSNFIKASYRKKQNQIDVDLIGDEITRDKNQFFSRNNHQIFETKYHRINSQDLKRIRKDVSNKFKKLHDIIYPQFKNYGLYDLNCHHNSREIVSRHFFNPYSGNYINSIWLHYGKSNEQLSKYLNADKSINRPYSFINNIRMQIIMHEKSLGIWLVLGRNNGSSADREYFKNQLQNKSNLTKYFSIIKLLQDYWIDSGRESVSITNLKDENHLLNLVDKSEIDNYFIIGKEIHYLDKSISIQNISDTILSEFQKLHPLYILMKHS